MSYSFTVRAATKSEAKTALAAKFDETVLQSQPVHAHDRATALAAGGAFIDLLADDETKDVHVSLNGWVSYQGAGDDKVFTAASVGASVSLVAKEA